MVILLLIEYNFSYYFRFLRLFVCVYPFHSFFPNHPFYSNHTCAALAIHVNKTVLESTGFYLTVHLIAQQVPLRPSAALIPPMKAEAALCVYVTHCSCTFSVVIVMSGLVAELWRQNLRRERTVNTAARSAVRYRFLRGIAEAVKSGIAAARTRLT